MSYQVIARKFRPQSFSEISGQEHVTRTLSNAIKRNKIAHAYLFTGLRGVGKTSIARIFAKSLNCVDGPTATPCQKCPQCLDITKGSSLAVREIDGASNNGVENVRDLIDSFMTLPPPGSKYKIYIIDEVHMLSISAFNALLKTLEEPPSYAIFILATTEVHKIPETILSRCQRHDLRALTQEEVVNRLKEICKIENLEFDDASLKLIARVSGGSMRDAQTMLDRVQSFCENGIFIQDTSSVLGIVERAALFRMSQAIFSAKVDLALNELNQVFSRGVNPASFINEFVSHWRELLLAKISSAETLVGLDISKQDIEELREQVNPMSSLDVQELARIAREEADRAIRSSEPRFCIEALLVRMALRQPVKDLTDYLSQVRKEVVATGNKQPAVVTNAATKVIPTPETASNAIVRKMDSAIKVKEKVQEVENIPSSSAKVFVWEEFIKYMSSQSGGKVLSEQLKRVGAYVTAHPELGSHTLEIKGASFLISTLSKNDTKQKLISFLTSYLPKSNWQLKMQEVQEDNAVREDSITGKENKTREMSRKQRIEELENHPTVKSLQKFFPGTTIESITFKNDD